MEPRFAATYAPLSSSLCLKEGRDSTLLCVSGMVPRPACFSETDLKKFSRRELGQTEIVCFSGRHIAQVDSYAGVRLTDLLEACGFSEQPRSELKRCVIVAMGHDGYEAIFSWSELYNTSIGQMVLVLHEKNSQELDEHMGRLCLISANDSRLGPRHLRGLFEVKVISLESGAAFA